MVTLKKRWTRNLTAVVASVCVYLILFFGIKELYLILLKRPGVADVYQRLFWLPAMTELTIVGIPSYTSYRIARGVGLTNKSGVQLPVLILGGMIVAAGLTMAVLEGFSGSWISRQFTNLCMILSGIAMISNFKRLSD